MLKLQTTRKKMLKNKFLYVISYPYFTKHSNLKIIQLNINNSPFNDQKNF